MQRAFRALNDPDAQALVEATEENPSNKGPVSDESVDVAAPAEPTPSQND